MICYQMVKKKENIESSEKRLQLNVTPSSTEFVERLETLAKKFKKKSKSSVGLEIIEQYVDFWEYSENIKANIQGEQLNKFNTIIQQFLKETEETNTFKLNRMTKPLQTDGSLNEPNTVDKKENAA